MNLLKSTTNVTTHTVRLGILTDKPQESKQGVFLLSNRVQKNKK